MSDITTLIEYEEGFKSRPYYCSERYPTVGFGFKLGPQNAPLPSFYLPRGAAFVWLGELLVGTHDEMQKYPAIAAAYKACADNEARKAVLISMAYQLGVPGLSKFNRTLALCAAGDWQAASTEMLDSLWARQTPGRALRHSQQLLTGVWCPLYAGV